MPKPELPNPSDPAVVDAEIVNLSSERQTLSRDLVRLERDLDDARLKAKAARVSRLAGERVDVDAVRRTVTNIEDRVLATKRRLEDVNEDLGLAEAARARAVENARAAAVATFIPKYRERVLAAAAALQVAQDALGAARDVRDEAERVLYDPSAGVVRGLSMYPSGLFGLANAFDDVFAADLPLPGADPQGRLGWWRREVAQCFPK